jgi:hypothetical protein
MRKGLIIALAGIASFGAYSAANAADGCGAGWHRNDFGDCRPNHRAYYDGDRYYRSDIDFAPSVGVYYDGRGYWDGNRYWSHRERWHDSWRYW